MNKVKQMSLKGGDIPEKLRLIDDAPKELYVLGDLESLLKRPCLAVVGSRKITAYGKAVTDKLVREVAGHGVVIISGLALGADAAAHEACLAAGGQTIAVLPTSLDNIEPRTNVGLARRILEQGGALVSEYPNGMPPLRVNFIARNRIVSGLSGGVLITEAAAKSGTMHTANFALGQGKTVMAVPGSILSPLSEGANNLIKTGAIPVTETKDIFLALGLTGKKARQTELFAANEEEASILKLLQAGLTDASDLLQQSGLSAANFGQTLTMLEINGKIRPLGANHWTIL